uniref:AC5 n=1 Tax=Pepper golden mosaic virus TaxID=223301 RepID=A0A6B9TLT1_9GEMI|nr:AC5 [Pepper golden mosaic virus]
MILVFASFLVVVDDVVVHLPETPNQRLLVAGILSTCNLSGEPVHDLETITQIVLHGGCARLVVVHVEHLTKIHRGTIWSPISHEPEHDAVGVVLEFDILVHPYLTQNVCRLHAETLAYTVSNTVTTCHVRNAHDLANMRDIMPLLE